VGREKKELKTVQAKQSMDSVKAVSTDRAVKNKAERDRSRVNHVSSNLQ